MKLSWHSIGQLIKISYLWVILAWLFDKQKFNELIEDHELPALISEPTCFKSINKTCSDNFLARKKFIIWML